MTTAEQLGGLSRSNPFFVFLTMLFLIGDNNHPHKPLIVTIAFALKKGI